MVFKLLGCIIVIAASSLLGYSLSRDFARRPQQLRELQGLLQIFENEITYLSSPLKEAFEKIGQAGRTEAAAIFLITAGKLERGQGATAYECWKAAVTESIGRTALNGEDTEILVSFGKILGSSDLDGQIKNIRLALAQLKLQEQKAEECRAKNEGMYKKLGVLGGLALVILLF